MLDWLGDDCIDAIVVDEVYELHDHGVSEVSLYYELNQTRACIRDKATSQGKSVHIKAYHFGVDVMFDDLPQSLFIELTVNDIRHCFI